MDNPEIDADGNKYWYNEHKELHREAGPAIVYCDGDEEYWINNEQYGSLKEGLMDQALG